MSELTTEQVDAISRRLDPFRWAARDAVARVTEQILAVINELVVAVYPTASELKAYEVGERQTVDVIHDIDHEVLAEWSEPTKELRALCLELDWLLTELASWDSDYVGDVEIEINAPSENG